VVFSQPKVSFENESSEIAEGKMKTPVLKHAPQFLILLIHSLVSLTFGLISDDLVVDIKKHGKIQGLETSTSDGKKVSAWYGIPYAQPPTGSLRFRHPRPIEPWSGVKRTQEQPNSCIQYTDVMFPDFAGSAQWNTNTKQSEDCLYLNVVVPKPHPKNAAVLLWIYGGGFWSGTATLDLYDMRTMVAEENIIMVGIQYRVASLAFLYFDTTDVPGNAGMFDQIMAMQWVKDHIASFGGNPNNITLMGESAGAASVSLHLLSPLSRDLFSQAIMQSATANTRWAVVTKSEGKLRGLRLAELMDCPHDGTDIRASIDCLREADATKMVNAEWNGITHGFTGLIGIFCPIIDGAFLDSSPEMSLKQGNFKKANILMGANKNEGNYFILYYFPKMFPKKEEIFVNRADFIRTIKEAYPQYNELQRKAISFEYTNWLNPEDPVANRNAVDRYTGDKEFTCPVVEFAHRYAETGNNVYMYYFTQRPSISKWPEWAGAMHADEISFVFGAPLNVSNGYTQEEVTLSKQIMSYWANFAKTGNPSLSADHTWTETYWPLHTPLKRETLTLHAGGPAPVLEGHRVRKCAFWNKFLPHLANPTPSNGMPQREAQECSLECCSSAGPSLTSLTAVILCSSFFMAQ